MKKDRVLEEFLSATSFEEFERLGMLHAKPDGVDFDIPPQRVKVWYVDESDHGLANCHVLEMFRLAELDGVGGSFDKLMDHVYQRFEWYAERLGFRAGYPMIEPERGGIHAEAVKVMEALGAENQIAAQNWHGLPRYQH